MPERLTADQLWTLRERLRGTEREHATDSVRLLWIPDDLYDPPESDRAPSQGGIGLSEIVDRASDAEQLDRERVASEEPDPTPKSDSTQSSQDSTDATNGDPDGPHDQTGAIGKAEYWEVEAEGTKLVVDRSRAQVGSKEDHLFIIYTKKGWCQYQRRHTLTGTIELTLRGSTIGAIRPCGPYSDPNARLGLPSIPKKRSRICGNSVRRSVD